MSDQQMADGPTKSRGLGVTAITAILNLNSQPFNFAHLKYPEYNRQIPPGLFRYPRNTTAPINWGADANGLIQFGGAGTMWQHNVGDWSIRYKAGGNPVNDGDGDIIYTRRPSLLPGEHYLVLGIRGNTVTTLKSYVPGEALLENLREDLLNVLNVFKPADYITLAENIGTARMMVDSLKAAGDAGHLEGLDKRDVEALLGVSHEAIHAQLQQLTPEDRELLQSGNAGPRVVTIMKHIFTALGLAIAGATVAIAVFLGILAKALALLGPVGWALSIAVGVAIVAILVAGLALALMYLLFAWLFSVLEGSGFMALQQQAPL
jgi:small-conductance mechanosensitive channel